MVKAHFLIEDGVVVFIFKKKRYPMSCHDISKIIAEKKEMQFSPALDLGGQCRVHYSKNTLQFHVEGNVFVLPIKHYEEIVHDGTRSSKGSRKKDIKTYEIDSLDVKGPKMMPSPPVDTAGREKNDSLGQKIKYDPEQESPDLDRLNLMNDMQRIKKGPY
jgi:hypothetical protein